MIPEVIDELDGEYRTALPKKKSPIKKGDRYNSSMGVNNDGLSSSDMINGMSVRDAIMSLMRFREAQDTEPNKENKKE